MPGQRDDAAAGWGASGPLYAVGAYGIWGIVPIYWKWLSKVPALELVAPRIVWTALLLVVLLAISGRAREIAFGDRRLIRPVLVAALLVAFNWFIFIHAVQTDQVLATSLGYYINPLVSVALGLVVLGERLRPLQWVAVALAAAGVAAYAVNVGALPWISVVLALSFGLYGLVHKMNPQPPLPGLAREMLVLTPIAAGLVAWLAWTGQSTLSQASVELHGLVALSGVVTATPLFLFREATARLPLVAVGMFQYIAPTLTMSLAVGLFGEPFTRAYGVTFACVWAGLAVFTVDAFRAGQAAAALRARG